ncbi:MAG: hypothetical protein DMF03_07850 [Verrucomicrobia bacterium]|nr:MAG: hypothetical protein DMF03_07850 [Verrucomicrobiota bacterium]
MRTISQTTLRTRQADEPDIVQSGPDLGIVCAPEKDICDCLRAIAFPYENARKKPFAGSEFIPILRALRIRA